MIRRDRRDRGIIQIMESLRLTGPPLLALITVLAIDFSTSRRGLQPPQFQWRQDADSTLRPWRLLRWGVSLTALWAVLWLGVFAPLGTLGQSQEIDLSQLRAPQLFALHLLLVVCVAVWYSLGFKAVGGGPRPSGHAWTAQLGFRTPRVAAEVGLGVIFGVAAWLGVLAILLSVGVTLWWIGGERLLPSEPPPLIPWIAALPAWLRIGVSLSAGVVEETFFRGFLQPRAGIALSTGLFVLAHASYEQPLLLLGISLLSLIYAGLVRWRQNIWPAIAAHVLFDAIQLLVVIPAALRLLPEEGGGSWAPVAAIIALGAAGIC